MKIELKRIQYYARQSEETNAFNADLYINGKKIGEASNRGHGGPTDYDADTAEGRKIIKEAEAYCKSLPPETSTFGDESYTFDMSLEAMIDNLVDNYVNQKETQKFRNWVDRKSKDCFMVGKPDMEVTASFKFRLPIEQILSGPKGDEMMTRAVIRDVIPELKDGNILLNTNIPENILKEAGLKEGQYLKPIKPVIAKQSQRKGKSI